MFIMRLEKSLKYVSVTDNIAPVFKKLKHMKRIVVRKKAELTRIQHKTKRS